MELTHEQISEFILKATSNSDGFNQLIEVILNSLMHHERRMFLDDSSDSGNGFRPRRFCYGHYEFRLKVPRTRQGSFYPVLLAVIKREDEERARLFTSLYSKGLTTEQIGEVAEELYGKHYSKPQVSYLSRSCAEEVEAWLNRELANRYLAVFIDATFSPTRRGDSVRREAYYTLLGLLPDGRREVLGIVNHPTEGAINWQQELLALQERGVSKIDLIVSDALAGIENAVTASFPMAKHQLCVTHLKRNMAALVPHKKRGVLMEELKEIFPMEQKGKSVMQQYQLFCNFVEKWSKAYPRFSKFKHERNIAHFTYLQFPPQVQRMIYTTNWIERLNRDYKRVLKMRGAMPSPQAVLFLLGEVARSKTETTYSKKLPYIGEWLEEEALSDDNKKVK